MPWRATTPWHYTLLACDAPFSLLPPLRYFASWAALLASLMLFSVAYHTAAGATLNLALTLTLTLTLTLALALALALTPNP